MVVKCLVKIQKMASSALQETISIFGYIYCTALLDNEI